MKNLYKLTTLLIAVTMSTSLMAADQVVTSNANSGAGTLRQAIVDAGDDDEITFNLASGSETIIISSELGITESLTINGYNNATGNNVTVQVTTPGTSTFRVFNINASGKTITISNMTIKGGDISGNFNTPAGDGGGIFINDCSTLNINYCTISNSKAYDGGAIGFYWDNSTSATVNLAYSKLLDNEATYRGGGIYIRSTGNATLNVSYSTISSNYADDYGGGLWSFETTTIQNSTVFGNSSGLTGGGISAAGNITIENTTIANNIANYRNQASTYSRGGGIYHILSTLAIKNTIIANNTCKSDQSVNQDYYYNSGTLTDNGYNVVEYADDYNDFGLTSDIVYNWDEEFWAHEVYEELSNQTLDLASGLSYNGGYNETLPVTGSGFLTASEGAGSTTETTDQRGYYRKTSVYTGETPSSATANYITRGAYQYYGVVARSNSVDNWSSGSNNYYSTIDGAAYKETSGTIILAGTAILESDIALAQSETITIQGDGATSTFVQADDTPNTASDRVYNITAGTVTLEDMTIRNGNIINNGGGIYNAGILTINNSTICDNRSYSTTGNSTLSGGGIYNSNTLTINNSIINGNSVSNTVTSNNVYGYGGGIFTGSSTTLTINNSTIFGNSASAVDGSGDTKARGGGLVIKGNSSTTVNINNSTFSGNSLTASGSGSGTEGAGIYFNKGTFTIRNSILANNTNNSSSYDYFSTAYSDTELDDQGYNVVEYSSRAATAIGGFDNATDIFYNTKSDGTTGYSTWNQNNSDLVNQNLYLSSTLSDNGGPTLSLALSSGSFADGAIPYSAGTNTFNGSTDLDQRGYCRACDGSRDIGAYEYDATTPSNGDYISIATGNWSSTSTWNTYNSTTKLWADASSEPASDKNVTISNGDAVTVDGTGDAANALTVSEGATLTISDTKDLDINGNLVNSGTFTINSSASGTGSLIVEGTATGSVVMHRYIAAATWGTWDDGWHFLSSPVANYPIATNFTATDYDFYAWSEKYNVWVNYKDGTNPAFDDEDVNGSNNFELGRGYLAAYKLESTRNFTGTINVANVEITGLTITGEGNHRSWHLLGNPFNSALTWYTDWTKSNIAGTAKIWHEGNKSYSDIAADGIIPATNGFMVQASGGTGTLTIPKAERIHSATAFYKSSEYPIIKLKATNIDYPSAQESQLRFNPKSTFGWDMEFDGDFLSGFAPHFYSTVEGVPQSVNSMPDLKGTTAVPFTFIKNDGLNFSIELYEVENMVLDVWLLDKKLNNNHNLSQNPLYLFTAFEQDDHERFVIQFAPVGIDEEQSPHSNIQTWASNKTIHIVNPENSRGEIRVLNLFGQQVAQAKLTGDTKQQIQLNVPTGCYLVNVVSEEGVVTRKVMVN